MRLDEIYAFTQHIKNLPPPHIDISRLCYFADKDEWDEMLRHMRYLEPVTRWPPKPESEIMPITRLVCYGLEVRKR